MKPNDVERISRRNFLASVPIAASVPLLAGAAGAVAAEKAKGTDAALALNGARRCAPRCLNTSCPGSQFYDHCEQDLTDEAIATHGLFRWYGPEGRPQPNKAATFEKEFAKLLGAKYVLGVTSGTAALHTALTALGIGPGDEVILPAWTWYSCYYTILMTGACQCSPRTTTPSPSIRWIWRRRSLRKPRPSWSYTCSDRRPTWTP